MPLLSSIRLTENIVHAHVVVMISISNQRSPLWPPPRFPPAGTRTRFACCIIPFTQLFIHEVCLPIPTFTNGTLKQRIRPSIAASAMSVMLGFSHLISHQLLFLPSYKTCKGQISDTDAGCVNKTLSGKE